jgi:hypothetical protein
MVDDKRRCMRLQSDKALWQVAAGAYNGHGGVLGVRVGQCVGSRSR